ncbi:MAG: M81 family metallopeptidase [Rhizobiaceae bacterium]|nr:M81 family metallopeptidase [Rhizobiaceae bacterium]
MASRPRIAIAGMQHETNTFAPFGATYDDFVRADGWPEMTRGDAIIDVFTPLAIPIGGFIRAARAECDFVPLVWAAAEPCSYVTDDAFDRISAMICDGIAAAGHLDAVYLDLHGAMVVESHEDGEGELMRRVRAVVGPDLPFVVSLDMHANITEGMVANSDALAVYRTYPHIDMLETGERAYSLLRQRMANGRAFHKALRKPPFLIPLYTQCTDFEPCKSLYAGLPALERGGVANIDIGIGFPPADIAECGPAVVAYGTDAAAVDAAADKVLAAINAAESQFSSPLLTPAEATSYAMRHGRPGEPIVIADLQDNPGAGGTSDTVGLLRAMVEGGVREGALGLLWDPQTAALAHEAGVGAELELAIGGRYGYDAEPFRARVRVEALSDGHFTCHGAILGDLTVSLGKMARLRILDDGSDVQVAVCSVRYQCLDQGLLRAVGIEPKDQAIVALKSSVHFRADFDSIAKEIILVESPGANFCRGETVTYKNLRSGVRLGPCGPAN